MSVHKPRLFCNTRKFINGFQRCIIRIIAYIYIHYGGRRAFYNLRFVPAFSYSYIEGPVPTLRCRTILRGISIMFFRRLTFVRRPSQVAYAFVTVYTGSSPCQAQRYSCQHVLTNCTVDGALSAPTFLPFIQLQYHLCASLLFLTYLPTYLLVVEHTQLL